MAPPVAGKAPAKKPRSAAEQPVAARPLRNVVPDSVDFRDRPYRPAVAFAPRPRLPAPPATHRPRLNQHDTSVCTGFALATVVHVLTSRRDSAPADPVSAFMLCGMAKFFDTTVARRNLPHLQYRVAHSSLATGATKHGNVDDDTKTQASVLAHIQGKPIPPP